jgi:hypothetical protein
LTKQALHDFLLRGNIAKIATIDENGSPYVNPVWYEWDSRSFFLIGRVKSKYVAHIRRNNQIAICVDEDVAPYTRVTAQGKAIILPDFDWVPMARRMAARYIGERGPSYIGETLTRKRVVIRLDPTYVQT